MIDYFIRDWYHLDPPLPSDVENHNGISKTVPNQGKPLKDMLNDSIVPSLPTVYEGYTGLPDVRKMSKVEKEEFRREVYNSINSQQLKLARIRDEKKKADSLKEQEELKRKLDHYEELKSKQRKEEI